MVIAKKKVTAAKSVKKPVTSNIEVVSSSLWSLSTRIEDCAYELEGVSDVIGLYVESDGFLQRSEALWLACRELDRLQERLISLADKVMHHTPAK